MTCWLKFLKFAIDSLKEFEPNLGKRKRLAIEILKDIEKEEGHDLAKIEKRVKSEGTAGILARARKKKKKSSEQDDEKEESYSKSDSEEEYESVYTCSEE